MEHHMRNLCPTTTSLRMCVYSSCLLFMFLTVSSRDGSLAATIGSSLTLGSSISYDQSITSSNSTYEFGFFSLRPGSSSVYLGIWYANLTPFTSVWIANREKAVSRSATCVLNLNGRVALTDRGETVWSIGESSLRASSVVLLDTGNLILQSSNSSVMWQSFDHPGNTWLPNMLLGPGKKLQSWLAPDDPFPGPYALMMGNSSNFVCVFNGSTIYYDSGYWDGEKFSNVPEMLNNYIFSFSFNSSSGFTWEATSSKPNFAISKLELEYSGSMVQSSYQVSDHSWSSYWMKPDNPCDVKRMCGQNSICDNMKQPNCKCPATGLKPVREKEWDQNIYTHGCERKSPLDCSKTHGSTDGFISVNQTTFDVSFSSSMAMEDLQKCKDLCLANCSCKGLFFFNADGYGNCSLFSDDLYDGTASSSAMGTFYIRVSAIDVAYENLSSRKHRTFSSLFIALLVGGIVILLITSLAVLLAVKRRRPAAGSQPEAGLRAFSYAELQAATNNFKEKLGSGGFGTVYRGLSGNVALAVKKLDRLGEGEKQFRAEVRTIGTIQHVNLVRLLGFCSEGKHRLLVYEMAQNGSLDSHLFADNDARAAALTWPIRRHIALGAARGIAYLHESCRERIIHCDIKPENILLDASYNVKLSDFGLAKLMGREFSRALTTLRGTRGYLAPEWIAGMPITSKADVYSFGMTLLELISGQRNIHSDPYFATRTSSPIFFPIRVARHVHQPRLDLACLLDPRIQGDVDTEELKQMALCAIWCIQDNEDMRPSMGEVVKILEGSMLVNLPPIPKMLQCLVESDNFNSNDTHVLKEKEESISALSRENSYSRENN